MKIDKFLKDVDVGEITDKELPQEAKQVILGGAIVAHNPKDILLEIEGTIYQIKKSDISDIDYAKEPIVTATSKGVPVELTVQSDVDLVISKTIKAGDLKNDLPFVLAESSQATNIDFPEFADPDEQRWLLDRGLVPDHFANTRTSTTSSSASNSMSTHWSDTTSPSTSRGGLDDWRSDDSRRDGNHPDDNRFDDNPSDDHRYDGP